MGLFLTVEGTKQEIWRLSNGHVSLDIPETKWLIKRLINQENVLKRTGNLHSLILSCSLCLIEHQPALQSRSCVLSTPNQIPGNSGASHCGQSAAEFLRKSLRSWKPLFIRGPQAKQQSIMAAISGACNDENHPVENPCTDTNKWLNFFFFFSPLNARRLTSSPPPARTLILRHEVYLWSTNLGQALVLSVRSRIICSATMTGLVTNPQWTLTRLSRITIPVQRGKPRRRRAGATH